MRGRQLYFTFPSALDPLLNKVSKAPFLTLRVPTPLEAPRQAPLDLLLQSERTQHHLHVKSNQSS